MPKPIVMPYQGWTVTEKGHHDLRNAETCRCQPRLAGLLVECMHCGTVYGHLNEAMNRLNGSAEYKRR